MSKAGAPSTAADDPDEFVLTDGRGRDITEHDGVDGIMDVVINRAGATGQSTAYHRADPDADGNEPACNPAECNGNWRLPYPAHLASLPPCRRPGCFPNGAESPSGYSDDHHICGAEKDDGEPCRRPVGIAGMTCAYHRGGDAQ